MMNCHECGAANGEHDAICVGCGRPLNNVLLSGPQNPQAPQPDEWQDVQGPVNHVTLRLSVKCNHCAAPVPLNGPTQLASCDKCMKDSPLSRVPEELALAGEGMQQFGSSYSAQRHSDPAPQCSKCDASIPIAQYLGRVGAKTMIPCPNCGAGCPTYPAPQWLRSELPMALQVFGGDPQTARDQGGLHMQVASEKPQPVVMTCPNCRAGLTISADNQRTTECTFCHASVFLPDELWKQLHPARTMTLWTLTYVGVLKTAEELKKDEARLEEMEREMQRAAEGPPLPQKHKSGTGLTWLVLVGAICVPLYFGFWPALSELFFSDQETLRNEGVLAPAKILSVTQTSNRFNNHWIYDLSLEVQPKGEAPFRVQVSEPLETLHVANLRQGAWVEIRFDPADRKSVALVSTGATDPELRWSNIPCFCTSEGETEDRKVQLALSIDDKAVGPFNVAYRLHVADKQYDLAVTDQTAPQSTVPSRLLELVVHCTKDNVVVGTQENVSAWSLDSGKLLWSTQLEQRVDLLAGPAPRADFSVSCREIEPKKGELPIPLGKKKRALLDIATGEFHTKK